MMSKEDLSGKTYNRLTVVGFSHTNAHKKRMWKCVCECGNTSIVTTSELKSGLIKSCGCINPERIRETKTTHGDSEAREYKIWSNVIQRCTNANNPKYCYYGGRGITVCNEWRNDYSAFISDMGTAPSDKHTIDRKDNSKGYSKENCRWATVKEQSNNRRSNRIITVEGKTMNAIEFAEKLGIKKQTLSIYLNVKKLTPEQLLTKIRSMREVVI